VLLGGVATRGVLVERPRLPGLGLLLLPHLVEDVRVAVRRRRVRVPVAELGHRRAPRRRLIAARAALGPGPLDGVGDEAVAAALGAVRVHRRLLDAVPAASPRRLAAGVAVVRRPGVGAGRPRRRVAGAALVPRGRRRSRRRPPGIGAVRRRRGDGEGLRVLGGVVGVDHLAAGALALARVLEVERVRHVAIVVPVAELGDVRVLLLLRAHKRSIQAEKDQPLPQIFFLEQMWNCLLQCKLTIAPWLCFSATQKKTTP